MAHMLQARLLALQDSEQNDTPAQNLALRCDTFGPLGAWDCAFRDHISIPLLGFSRSISTEMVIGHKRNGDINICR